MKLIFKPIEDIKFQKSVLGDKFHRYNQIDEEIEKSTKLYFEKLKWALAYDNDTLSYRHDYTGNDLNDAQKKCIKDYKKFLLERNISLGGMIK